LRENAALNIIGDITSVTLASVVVELGHVSSGFLEEMRETYISWSEGAGKESFLRISSNRSELFGESKNDVLVDGSGIGRGRILMLLDSLNLGVDSSLVAANTGQSNLASVSLQSCVQQSIRLTSNIPSCLCIGESLIGSSLMKTVQVGDLSSTGSSSRVTEKTEDRVLNLVGVVEVQVDSDAIEESVVRVLLRHFTAHHGAGDGECEGILGDGSGCRGCKAKEGSNNR